MADLAHHRDGFVQGGQHVAQVRRQRFGEDRHAPGAGVVGNPGEALPQPTCRFRHRGASDCAPLPAGAEDHQPFVAEVGTEIDQMPEVGPTAFPHRRVRSRDVQLAPGRGQEAMEPHIADALRAHRIAKLAAPRCRDRRRIVRERERSDLDAFVARAERSSAGARQVPALESLVADRQTERAGAGRIRVRGSVFGLIRAAPNGTQQHEHVAAAWLHSLNRRFALAPKIRSSSAAGSLRLCRQSAMTLGSTQG